MFCDSSKDIVSLSFFDSSNKVIFTDSLSLGNNCGFESIYELDTNVNTGQWRVEANYANDVKDWKKGLIEGKEGKYKNWKAVASDKIVIKDKAWIGFNSIILKGVTVGEGSIVGAGSVVTKDVPDYTVVAGNPAIIVKTLNER